MFSEAHLRADDGSTPELHLIKCACVFILAIHAFLAKYMSVLAFIWLHVCFVHVGGFFFRLSPHFISYKDE